LEDGKTLSMRLYVQSQLNICTDYNVTRTTFAITIRTLNHVNFTPLAMLDFVVSSVATTESQLDIETVDELQFTLDTFTKGEDAQLNT
jgi:hypothetical protein